MKPEIFDGSVVISQKGRDKGRAFVVLCHLDADFVLIADGDTHPLEKLKKKRRKHLRSCPCRLEEIAAAYREGRLKNSDIRKALYPFMPRAEVTDSGREEPIVEG